MLTELEYEIIRTIVRSKRHCDELLADPVARGGVPTVGQCEHYTCYGYWQGVNATAKRIADRMGIDNATLVRECQRIAGYIGREQQELNEFPSKFPQA
jgi:hypothetical protein